MNKVLKPFQDKTDNKKPYRKGDFYSHDDDDRIAFLIKEGFLEEKSKQPPKEVKKPTRQTKKKADKDA